MDDTPRIDVLGILLMPVSTIRVGDSWRAWVPRWPEVTAESEDFGEAVATLKQRLDAELVHRATR